MKGKRFGTKQIIPIVTFIFGVVFAWIGFTQLGFWEGEPQPGFFPAIVSIVLCIASVLAFIQSLKEDGRASYNKEEMTVILGGLAVIAGTMIIGLIPSAFLYILIWLKGVEKNVPWRDVIIIEIIVMAIVIGVFQTWLGVQFPWGIFEKFM